MDILGARPNTDTTGADLGVPCAPRPRGDMTVAGGSCAQFHEINPADSVIQVCFGLDKSLIREHVSKSV